MRSDGIILPPVPQQRPWREGGRAKRRSLLVGVGAVINPDGTVESQGDEWLWNALCDEGEASVNNVYLKETANVSKYLALIAGGTTPPGETSTMAYLGGGAGAQEIRVPGVDGYNRIQIVGSTDWTDDGLIGGDSRFSAAEKTFGPCTGTAWSGITHACLVTAATGQLAGSGKFLLFVPTAASTTIAVSQAYKLILRWTTS